MQVSEILTTIRSGKAGREKVIRRLYDDQKLKAGIQKVIRSSNATEEEFNDIFNLTLVQFLKGVIEKPNFKIKTNLNSYLFGVARNLWLMKLRKQKNDPKFLPESYEEPDSSEPIDLQIINQEKKIILNKILEQVGTKCKEVLMYWASGYKMQEIASMLDYTNESSVRKKKFDCMKNLSNFLNANTQLKEQLRQ